MSFKMQYTYVLYEVADYWDGRDIILGVFETKELAEEAFVMKENTGSCYIYQILVFKKNSCELVETIEL